MKFHSLALSALIVTFGESSFVPSSFQRNCIHCNNNAVLQRSSKLHAYTLDDNKWESLGIDGEQEPQWYILNCMATAEMTVLKNLQDNCMGATSDIIKFSVPTETKGTSRMKKTFSEEKPLFQGYVFVYCKLTQASYDSIAEVKSVRGWMGMPRQIGWRKLSPIPTPLEGSELKKFHLLEDEQIKKEDAIATGVFDPKNPDFDITFGFSVGQYVKILSGPHEGEDAVVRKFRDGKIGVRMFTYGSQFDAMLESHQLRKMNELEVASGLGGPERAINQEYFNKEMGLPPPGGRGRNGDAFSSRVAGRGEQRRERNRRQDRNISKSKGDMFGRSDDEIRSEAELWDQFKQSTDKRSNRRTRDNSIFDENAGDDMGKTTVGKDEDDFFSDLMSELEGSIEGSQEMKISKQSDGLTFDNDDDFFAALEQEMNMSKDTPQNIPASDGSNSSIDDDDFFAALENEMKSSKRKKQTSSDDDDDFFATLEKEMSATSGNAGSSVVSADEDDFFANLESELSGSISADEIAKSDEDDFFTNLENELSGSISNGQRDEGDEEDFFANLETALDDMIGDDKYDESNQVTSLVKEEVDDPKSKNNKAKKANESENDSSHKNLSSFTVPQLKDMLREKGLPVSGRKAELIARLQN